MKPHPKTISGSLLVLFLLFPVFLGAQSSNAQSPIYNEDGSVTFVLKKTDSRRVKLYCDCALRNRKYNVKLENLHSVRMTRDPNGWFTYTTPPLVPEVYTYQFKSHRQRLIDPSNADSIRISDGKRSVFVIPGSYITDLCLTDSLCGKTELCAFVDTVSGKTRSILLYLPPQYDETEQSYPVLYLLHGIDGNEQAWHDRGRAIQLADNLIRQGKAEPMIIVMPDANPKELIGQDEHVSLMKNLLHYRSWFHYDFERAFPDMDKFISAHYRISSDTKMRAVCGLSAGSTQSVTLAKMYEDSFKYVGLFSPIVHRKQLPHSKNTIYWIGSGKTDIFHIQSKKFVKRIHQCQIPYIYYKTQGGHTWRNWRIYLSEFLQFIFKNNEEKTM
ncbi:MAG: hypothetical protein IKO62_00170 [Bacteroidales bacterium]|nr:hypothetical protein [Bacteroidales bacterium]